MSIVKKLVVIISAMALLGFNQHHLEAVTYVTDTGGYAYDEARAVTNLAPAIALGTVAIVGIIAIAVQNTHDHSSSAHYSYCYPSSYNSYCDPSSSYYSHY